MKWVGFFVTSLVGAYTIEDLWEKFGDLKMSVVRITAPRMLWLNHQTKHLSLTSSSVTKHAIGRRALGV